MDCFHQKEAEKNGTLDSSGDMHGKKKYGRHNGGQLTSSNLGNHVLKNTHTSHYNRIG